MKIAEVFRIALEAIRKNSVRSILTMLGIIIGVAAVIIMVAVSAGTEATIQEQITGLGTNLIFISQSFSRGGAAVSTSFSGGPVSFSSGGLTFDDADAIAANIHGVAAVNVEENTTQIVKAGDITLQDIDVLGTTPGFPSVRDVEIANGRYFTQEEVDRKKKVVILGADVAAELFGETDPVGQIVTVGTLKFAVIGVFEEKGTIGETDYDGRVYMPITTVFQKFTYSVLARFMGDNVRMIYVEVEKDANMENVILQIKLLLAKRHDVSLNSADFTITTQQDIITTQESTTSAFRSLLAWVAGVSLIVGGIGIMNIMLVSVTERTREIGIRQAIGANPGDIRMQFLTEALLISILGGLLGCLVGIGGAWLFSKLSEMRTVVDPMSILLAFGSAAIIGIFFGFYPANKAAQLEPIEALRYE